MVASGWSQDPRTVRIPYNGVRNTNNWTVINFFSRCISRKWDWKGSILDLNEHSGIGCQCFMGCPILWGKPSTSLVALHTLHLTWDGGNYLMGLIRIVGRKKMVLVLKFYSVAAGTEKYESKGTLRKKKRLSFQFKVQKIMGDMDIAFWFSGSRGPSFI